MTVSAGWYPDPWAPQSLRWWNGEAWTGESAPTVPHQNNSHWVLVGVATAWSALLLFLAIALPVYTVTTLHAGLQPRHSLIRVFGYRVLLIAAVPLVVSVGVGGLLRLRASTGSRWPALVAGALAGALLLAAFVGFLTFLIGIYVLPVGALLCIAVYSDSVSHCAAVGIR